MENRPSSSHYGELRKKKGWKKAFEGEKKEVPDEGFRLLNRDKGGFSRTDLLQSASTGRSRLVTGWGGSFMLR